jgi:uncharacterized membrane protein required for colicin V production
VQNIQTFDLVLLLALLAMFIVGYAQGVIRRLLGIAAILFSLILAAQLRDPVGRYLAAEWGALPPAYSFMVAFGAVFFAAAVTLSLGIQLTYRPAPLFPKYPVLDEILGGILGVLEGLLIIIALMLIIEPYYNMPEVRETVGVGEFRPLRTLYEFLQPTMIAGILRDNVIPAMFFVLGILFPADVRNAFAQAAQTLFARR